MNGLEREAAIELWFKHHSETCGGFSGRERTLIRSAMLAAFHASAIHATPANMAVGAVGGVGARTGQLEKVSAALIQLDAIYRDLVDTEVTPDRPTWLRDALHIAEAIATPAPEQATTGSGQDSGSVHLGSGDRGEVHAPGLRPVLQDVEAERQRQDAKWGGPAHDDAHDTDTFCTLIEGYTGWARVMAGMYSNDKARRRLVQVAALAVAACESIDRAAILSTASPAGEGEGKS